MCSRSAISLWPRRVMRPEPAVPAEQTVGQREACGEAFGAPCTRRPGFIISADDRATTAPGVAQQLCACRAGEGLFSVRVDAVAKSARGDSHQAAVRVVAFPGKLPCGHQRPTDGKWRSAGGRGTAARVETMSAPRNWTQLSRSRHTDEPVSEIVPNSLPLRTSIITTCYSDSAESPSCWQRRFVLLFANHCSSRSADPQRTGGREAEQPQHTACWTVETFD